MSDTTTPAAAQPRADSTLTVTPEAIDTIAAMYQRVADLAQFFGEDSPQYTQAGQSLARVMAGLFRWPQVRLMKDFAPLSLIAQAASLTMGLIFHPDPRHCTNDGCRAYVNDDGRVWTCGSGDPVCGEHTWSYPLDAPTPGTWSTHS